MKYAFAQVAFGLGVNALVARDASQQCMKLQAFGAASGVLGQLSDGQNRIGGGHGEACYCLNNGGFIDSNGRGCILTPPTTQFQCDAGASPTTGFAIEKDGITYNDSAKFYACPVNDKGEYNVYTQPAPGQDKCVEISLSSAGSCGSGGGAQSSKPAPQPSQPAQSEYPQNSKPAPQPSKPAPTPEQPKPSPEKPKPSKPAKSEYPQNSKPAPQPTPVPTPEQPKPSKPAQSEYPHPSQPAPQPPKPAESKPAPQSSQPAPQPSHPAESKPSPQPSTLVPKPSAPAQPSGSCPADLNGNYQYPHLIVPVDSSTPNSAPGTSYNGKVDSHTCSIFNFDIPQSYAGKTCSVVFLFPEQKDLETSSFKTSGNGQCIFSKLSSAADQKTSWANQPSKASDLGSYTLAPGNEYVVASGDCAAGQTVSYEMCAGGDFSLEYFQDYNPSPIGLYVRQC